MYTSMKNHEMNIWEFTFNPIGIKDVLKDKKRIVLLSLSVLFLLVLIYYILKSYSLHKIVNNQQNQIPDKKDEDITLFSSIKIIGVFLLVIVLLDIASILFCFRKGDGSILGSGIILLFDIFCFGVLKYFLLSKVLGQNQMAN
jgi:hypothetical protein